MKICTGVNRLGDRQVMARLPAAAGLSEQAAVHATDLRGDRGWLAGATRGARSWRELPAAAVKYVRRIEELIGAQVAAVTTSPERDDIIIMRDPFRG